MCTCMQSQPTHFPSILDFSVCITFTEVLQIYLLQELSNTLILGKLENTK